MSEQASSTSGWAESFKSLEGLESLANRLESLWRPPGAILIDGPLGVGKTTLVKAVLKAAGVADVVKSPSFDLVHPHQGRWGNYLHVDLFRLESPPPPEELDVDGEAALVLVEWGFPWAPWFPDRLEVRMQLADETRRLSMKGVGHWGRRLAMWMAGEAGGGESRATHSGA